MKLGYAFLITLLSATTAHAALGPDDDLIVPGERVGMVTRTTTASELAATLPKEAFKQTELYVGEGFCVHGAVVYPGTPKEMEISWKGETREAEWCSDTFGKEAYPEDAGRLELNKLGTPSSIQIRPVGKSTWHTKEGVRVGTSVRALQKINGKPFTFLGFGWDGSGVITSWKGGKISESLGGRVGISTEDSKPQNQKVMYQFLGDSEFWSNDSKLTAPAQLESIIISFLTDSTNE